MGESKSPVLSIKQKLRGKKVKAVYTFYIESTNYKESLHHVLFDMLPFFLFFFLFDMGNVLM